MHPASGPHSVMLCRLAAAVPFQACQFFLDGEGSMLLSASIGTAFAVSTKMPMFVHIPLVLLVSASVGAFWGFIPGILKAKTNANGLGRALNGSTVHLEANSSGSWTRNRGRIHHRLRTHDRGAMDGHL